MSSNLKKIIQKESQFSFIPRIKKTFPTAEIYLVGGAVRDALLERTSKDFDFVIRNVPLSKLQKFLQTLGVVNIVGKKFGVLKFVPKGATDKEKFEPFDIALPRTEFTIGNSGHYRDFEIQTDYRLSLDADLSRRDFTMNAIAWDVVNDHFIDPYGGIEDIQKKKIRCVGSPQRRFLEDYSRMLRALRFACQLDFVIEDKTYSAIKRTLKNLNKEIAGGSRVGKAATEVIRVVPFEVIAREFIKSVVAHPTRAFDLYDDTQAFKILMPELVRMKKCPQDVQWHSEGDVWVHTRLALQRLGEKRFAKEFDGDIPDALLVIAVLFHDIGKPYTIRTPKTHRVDHIQFHGHDRVGAEMTRKVAERLRFSSVERHACDIDTLYWLVKNHLLLLNADVRVMKESTLEKYFFKDTVRGRTLLKLIFADSLATVRADGKTSLTNYRRCVKRIAELKKRLGVRYQLPPSILNGDEIMKRFRFSPGPLIGECIEALREEQLSGRVKTKANGVEFLTSLLSKKKYENNNRGSTSRKKS